VLQGVVYVSIGIVAKPGNRSALVQGLRTLMLPAQAAPGFIDCRLLVDAEHPNSLNYVEKWRSTEDLDRRIRSSDYTRLLALMENAIEPPEVEFRWVSQVKGLEYLATLRLAEQSQVPEL
jgi:quinol monooxygenase YgiN